MTIYDNKKMIVFDLAINTIRLSLFSYPFSYLYLSKINPKGDTLPKKSSEKPYITQLGSSAREHSRRQSRWCNDRHQTCHQKPWTVMDLDLSWIIFSIAFNDCAKMKVYIIWCYANLLCCTWSSTASFEQLPVLDILRWLKRTWHPYGKSALAAPWSCDLTFGKWETFHSSIPSIQKATVYLVPNYRPWGC